MDENMRYILSKVASGELTPEDAEKMLAGEAAEPQTEVPPVAETSSQPGPAPEPVAKLLIRASGVRLTVVGDPSVATATADGPHRISHEGPNMVIHSDLSAGHYATEPPRSAFVSWLSTVNRAGSNLRVRVNPGIPVEILSIAGSLDCSALAAPTSIGVEAGSAKVHAGGGPLVLSVVGGSAEVEWRFSGTSSITTEFGSAKVVVSPESDAVVTADASLGSATLTTPDGLRASSTDTVLTPYTVGEGNGTLDVMAKLGSADVRIA